MKLSSGLEYILFSGQSWTGVYNDNFQLLEDTLLYLQNLIDVDVTSLTDQDILQWNQTSGKFENVPFYDVFPSTTTTTTTSSTTSSSTSSSTTTTAP